MLGSSSLFHIFTLFLSIFCCIGISIDLDLNLFKFTLGLIKSKIVVMLGILLCSIIHSAVLIWHLTFFIFDLHLYQKGLTILQFKENSNSSIVPWGDGDSIEEKDSQQQEFPIENKFSVPPKEIPSPTTKDNLKDDVKEIMPKDLTDSTPFEDLSEEIDQSNIKLISSDRKERRNDSDTTTKKKNTIDFGIDSKIDMPA